jgi:hypothetical protein
MRAEIDARELTGALGDGDAALDVRPVLRRGDQHVRAAGVVVQRLLLGQPQDLDVGVDATLLDTALAGNLAGLQRVPDRREDAGDAADR